MTNWNWLWIARLIILSPCWKASMKLRPHGDNFSNLQKSLWILQGNQSGRSQLRPQGRRFVFHQRSRGFMNIDDSKTKNAAPYGSEMQEQLPKSLNLLPNFKVITLCHSTNISTLLNLKTEIFIYALLSSLSFLVKISFQAEFSWRVFWLLSLSIFRNIQLHTGELYSSF